jgi:hypothetical protein
VVVLHVSVVQLSSSLQSTSAAQHPVGSGLVGEWVQ